MTGYRLPRGGRIDRGRSVSFTWDGTRHIGHPGDTVASALMAHGERVLARSFKYHRPRGVMTAGIEEGGALVTLGSGAARIPNVKATQAEIHDGLEVSGQNAWPSVRWDLGAVSGLLGRFFAAGFYYKTFFGVTGRGTREWMLFERFIRRAAGMGLASDQPDPDQYEIVNDHCDVLVVGSGPAGLAAAGAAAELGLDVVLAEQDFELGGSILSGLTAEIDGKPAEGWLKDRLSALGAAGVRLWPRTTAFGLYDHGVVGLIERVTDHLANPGHLPRERFRILRAGRIVLATGAIERPFVFGANDRPGVMLASAAATYVTRFGTAPGRRAILATNNDSAYAAATTLARAGIETMLLDCRDRPPEQAAEAARAAGVTLRAEAVPVEAKGARGVRALDIGRRVAERYLAEDGIACDVVGVSGGWTPVVNLLSHRGVRPVWDEALSAFLIRDAGIEPVTLAGAAAGQFTPEAAVAGGEAAGEAAAGACRGRRRTKAPDPDAGWERPLSPLWEVRDPGRHAKGFVDPQNDVTADDVRLAHREGFVGVEHLKRYTTLGMATDQGKFGNVVGLALMAEASGRTIPETGTTTFRPPFTPVSIGALAGPERGRHWRPTRHTPMRAEHQALGCAFVDAGFWRRSWYYPRAGESMAVAARRETTAVRNTVGMVDVSTLGKIMVQGPDGAEFLDRVYSNAFAKLPVGRARYGLMLRDDGIVVDDGTTWRLSEDRLADDDDHRQCRRRHAALGQPAADPLARAPRPRHLCLGPLGRRRHRRPARPRRARRRLPGHRLLGRGLPLHGRAPGAYARRPGRSDPGHLRPALLLGRDGVGGDVPRRLRARDVAHADDPHPRRGRRSLRPGSARHPARREGARHGARARRPDDGPRCRPRRHGIDEEALCRPGARRPP